MEVSFDSSLCIICQEGNKLTSTSNGSQQIRKAAEIRQDVVFDRLKGITEINQLLKYHLNPKCYKSYTNSKNLKKIVSEREGKKTTSTDSLVRFLSFFLFYFKIRVN